MIRYLRERDMARQLVELRLPDFALEGVTAVTCLWHAAPGEVVTEGSALVEVLAGEATIDLAAPASGVLVRRCVEIDERLVTGQVLALIEVAG